MSNLIPLVDTAMEVTIVFDVDAAIRCAVSMLDTPYELGAIGPATVDCSLLTQIAWSAGGLWIPRKPRDQLEWCRSLSIQAGEFLRPGALVFYDVIGRDDDDPGHVVMVVSVLGQLLVIHAPRPGRNVSIDPMGRFDPITGVYDPWYMPGLLCIGAINPPLAA